MKIDVKELRKIVKEVLAEEMDSSPYDRPTVPAAKSAGERQFQQDTGGQKWGNPKALPKDARPTVPAAHSSAEKQFQQDTGGQKWGNPKAIPRGGDTKNARVWTVVAQSMGSQMNDQQRQALRGELDAFLQSKDPSEKLIATADQLANEFAQSKKSA